METKIIHVSLLNHERLTNIAHKNDSYDDIITRVLDDYDEYQTIKDLIEADIEFENGEGVHFFSLKELEKNLDE